RNNKTLAALDAKYPGKLRFVFKHAPLSFHDRALPAAYFAIEARKQGGDALFFKAHDALYASPALDDDAFARIAGELGIDGKKALDAVAKASGKLAVEKDQAEGDDLDVKGTPCTFVNGRRVEGAESLAVFDKVVDEELKKAEAKIAGGLPVAKLYAETIAGGKGGPAELVIPKSAGWKGGAKAQVILHVFSDFQCPFCKRLEVRDPNDSDGKTGGLAAVQKKYGDKIKIVWRDYPLDFHARARPAAALAREALAQKGQAGFWKAHDALFAGQGDFSEPALEAIAKQIGLDWKKAKTALDEGTWSAAIEEDVKEGNRIGVSGTPTVFVDGHRIVGAQPEAVLVRAIDRALSLRAK
ncbi:MAG: DsbA family protein, partial [Polyangiales bacterium]